MKFRAWAVRLAPRVWRRAAFENPARGLAAGGHMHAADLAPVRVRPIRQTRAGFRGKGGDANGFWAALQAVARRPGAASFVA